MAQVPDGGMLLGSSGSRFVDQMATDIHLEDYWAPPPPTGLARAPHVCVTWGLAIVYVEDTPNQNAPWAYAPNILNNIAVQDNGQVGGPPLPNPPPLGQGAYNVNGQQVTGFRVPWNHHCTMTKPGDEPTMHYFKHYPRVNHDPPPPDIMPQNEGKHFTFSTLIYGAQVQNYRRIEG